MENFFYNSLCHVCKQPSENLKRCSLCKVLAYCCKEHQKEDWKNHKSLCKVIAETEKDLNDEIITYNDFKRHKITKSVLWQIKLKRQLKPFESQIWMFPRYCAVCFAKETVIECESCLNAYYCSTQHKETHREKHLQFCNSLKFCMLIDSYLYQQKLLPEIIFNKIPCHIKCLPSTIDEFIRIVSKNSIMKTEEDFIKFTLLCDTLAPAATLLFALEKSKSLDNGTVLKNLEIHIVGASHFEVCLNWFKMFEVIFHWISNLNRVTVTLIGPELEYNPNSFTEFANHFCNDCKKNKVKTILNSHKKMYHEIVDKLKKPDIIVGFNSGLHEYLNSEQDFWRDTLNYLVKYEDVPLILTSYTREEIKEDLDRLKSTGLIDVMLTPQRNCFSNVRPLRDWSTKDTPVFYANGYITIIRKKKVGMYD